MKGKAALWLACALGVLAMMIALGAGGESGAASQEEKRMAEVLSAIEGAGQVEVALFYAGEKDGLYGTASQPTGALVVAEGADEMGVRLQLIRAVRTLLGLPENAVDVFVMEDGQ